MKTFRLASILPFLILLPPSTAYADAIIMTRAMTASTIAEIFVEESAVRVELEIGLQDLPRYQTATRTIREIFSESNQVIVPLRHAS